MDEAGVKKKEKRKKKAKSATGDLRDNRAERLNYGRGW
jgi:hypothetical protein